MRVQEILSVLESVRGMRRMALFEIGVVGEGAELEPATAKFCSLFSLHYMMEVLMRQNSWFCLLSLLLNCAAVTISLYGQTVPEWDLRRVRGRD